MEVEAIIGGRFRERNAATGKALSPIFFLIRATTGAVSLVTFGLQSQRLHLQLHFNCNELQCIQVIVIVIELV